MTRRIPHSSFFVLHARDWLFVTVSTLLMSLPAGYEPHHFAKTLFAGAFVQSMAYSILLAYLTRKSVLVRNIVLVMLALLFGTETFTFLMFGSRFDPGILTLVLQTSRKEIGEFFQVYVLHPLPLLAIVGGVGVVILLLRFVNRFNARSHSSPLTSHSSPLTSHLSIPIMLLGFALPFIPTHIPLGKNTVNELAASLSFVIGKHKEIESMEKMLGKIRILCEPSAEEAPVVVLVIGESFNKHHSSLYGYPLPTSPRLQKERDCGRLIVFNHATTPTNGTSFAMRHIFSLKGCNTDENDMRQYVLMPAVFKKAHYAVAYFDNQYTRSSGGSLDYSCGYFLNPEVINDYCFDFRNETTAPFDADFINQYAPEFRKQPKSLNIIHLMGQHFDARLRYPDTFDIFSQEHVNRPDLSAEERQKVAEYDNATCYNDYTLSRILDCFHTTDAVVVYLSDHGEQVYDGPGHYFGRQFGDEFDRETLENVFEVPLMVWCSDLFKTRRPHVFEALGHLSDKGFCIDDLSYLLFHLAGISSNFDSPRHDMLHPSYQPHQSVIHE